MGGGQCLKCERSSNLFDTDKNIVDVLGLMTEFMVERFEAIDADLAALKDNAEWAEGVLDATANAAIISSTKVCYFSIYPYDPLQLSNVEGNALAAKVASETAQVHTQKLCERIPELTGETTK